MILISVTLLALSPFLFVYATLEPLAFSGWCLALCAWLCNPRAVGILAGWVA